MNKYIYQNYYEDDASYILELEDYNSHDILYIESPVLPSVKEGELCIIKKLSAYTDFIEVFENGAKFNEAYPGVDSCSLFSIDDSDLVEASALLSGVILEASFKDNDEVSSMPNCKALIQTNSMEFAVYWNDAKHKLPNKGEILTCTAWLFGQIEKV